MLLVALVYYTPVFVGVGGDVMLLFELVVFKVVVVQLRWSSGGGDACCISCNSNCCRFAILKCILGRGGGGASGGDGDVVVGVWWGQGIGGGDGVVVVAVVVTAFVGVIISKLVFFLFL